MTISAYPRHPKNKSLMEVISGETQQLRKCSDLATQCLIRYTDPSLSLSESLSLVIGDRIAGEAYDAKVMANSIRHAYEQQPSLLEDAVLDLEKTIERDPAAFATYVPFFFHKGFHALQIHRVASFYWCQGDTVTALLLSSLCASRLSVDIHPAARISSGVFIDHADGIVVGETAIVGYGCTLLHGVTLGGTGKEKGDRHPKIGTNVLLGAGSMVLGNIVIGDSSHVGAGAVVIRSVPANHLAIGIPATNRPISLIGETPAEKMDHRVFAITGTYDQI